MKGRFHFNRSFPGKIANIANFIKIGIICLALMFGLSPAGGNLSLSAYGASSYLTNNQQGIKKEKELPAGVIMQGIDVSRWQGSIDWVKVKKAGVDFAMVGMGRVYTDGYFLDPTFRTNVTQAHQNGIYAGAYLYSMASTVKQAKKEAEWVVSQLTGLPISFPVAFDLEDPSVQKLSAKKKTDIALAFMSTIRAAGYYPMIYSSDNWFRDEVELDRLSDYDIWMARWTGLPQYAPYCLWQYSCKGKVSGISTDVDLDFCFKDYAYLITGKAFVRTPPQTDAGDGQTAKAVKTLTKGWHKIDGHTVYADQKGQLKKSCFITLSGKKYYVNEKGWRVTGWQTIEGKIYYFSSKGVMQKGWLTLKGKKYYLHKTKGTRATGWATIGSKKYYFRPEDGSMAAGWQEIDEKTYYFTAKGVRKTGWLTLKGKKYYLDKKTGERKTGWLMVSKKKYYLLPESGAMARGWQEIGGKWYYFNKSGVMQKNRKVGQYRLGKDGVCSNR